MARKVFSVLTIITAVAAASAALAASSVTGMNTTLSASPANYKGKCPAVITFKGEIKVTGKFDPKAGPVQIGYTFLRSDGATGPIMYYDITGPNAKVVTTTWTLGGAALPTYAGWEQLKAWPTHHDGGFGYSFSPKAMFKVTCIKSPTGANG